MTKKQAAMLDSLRSYTKRGDVWCEFSDDPIVQELEQAGKIKRVKEDLPDEFLPRRRYVYEEVTA